MTYASPTAETTTDVNEIEGIKAFIVRAVSCVAGLVQGHCGPAFAGDIRVFHLRADAVEMRGSLMTATPSVVLTGPLDGKSIKDAAAAYPSSAGLCLEHHSRPGTVLFLMRLEVNGLRYHSCTAFPGLLGVKPAIEVALRVT